jgi:beta-1,4-mannosyl-glycoprotein beta-1,4-N-acetylglucosaminyltransferase
MKIYDCIMYYDDELTLSLRLNILDKYIDKFVIVEATRDHAGNIKKLNFITFRVFKETE